MAHSSARAGSSVPSAAATAASSENENSVPSTEARRTASRAACPSRSTRDRTRRSRAWGTGRPAVGAIRQLPSSRTMARVSSSAVSRSSRNSGLPSARSRTASRTSRPAPSPSRELASSSSAAPGSGPRGMRCTSGPAAGSRPKGPASSPPARLVPSTSRRRPWARRARSWVRRSEVGSAQCRSSRTSTTGAVATSRDTTQRQAANVSRCSSPGPLRPSAAPGARPIMRASSGNRSSPRMAASVRSRAGRTTAAGWSGVTPAQFASRCW